LTQLRTLRLDGMLRALEDDATTTAAAALTFEQRLALLVQREVDWRDGKRVARLLKAAKLKVSAAQSQTQKERVRMTSAHRRQHGEHALPTAARVRVRRRRRPRAAVDKPAPQTAPQNRYRFTVSEHRGRLR
jgi:hypothetical protein